MVSLNFVGDIGLFKEFQNKGIDPFTKVKLPKSDFNIGNFEFIISNNRKKNFYDASDKYAIDYEYFKTLNLSLFNAFGLANNHCMDYGKDGLIDVINVFEKNNISHFGVGSDEFNILKLELKGISFAFIAVVKNGRWSKKIEGTFGPDSYNIDKLIPKIKSLKEEVDHVIVFPHIGTELVDIPDPKDVIISRLLIDSGTSAVIGHHPHIIQGIENYNERVIAYSLGSYIYIPENEEGFKVSQNSNRDFSICLNLSFDKTKIIGIKPHYYKYDKQFKIPIEFNLKIPYFEQVNEAIDNSKDYYKKIRHILLKRELFSFYQRFKISPISTLKHYFKYLRFYHIKKCFPNLRLSN